MKHHPRKFGISKYGFNRILKVFSDIFAITLIIRFSSNPLKGFFLCAIPFILLCGCFGTLSVGAYALHWTAGKSLYFLISAIITSMAAIQLVALGILGELIVATSDLSYTHLPAVTRKLIVTDN